MCWVQQYALELQSESADPHERQLFWGAHFLQTSYHIFRRQMAMFGCRYSLLWRWKKHHVRRKHELNLTLWRNCICATRQRNGAKQCQEEIDRFTRRGQLSSKMLFEEIHWEERIALQTNKAKTLRAHARQHGDSCQICLDSTYTGEYSFGGCEEIQIM